MTAEINVKLQMHCSTACRDNQPPPLQEFGKIAAEMGNKSRAQCNHIYNDYKTADWFAPYLRKYNSLKRRLKARTRPFLAAGLGEPAPRARAAAGGARSS